MVLEPIGSIHIQKLETLRSLYSYSEIGNSSLSIRERTDHFTHLRRRLLSVQAHLEFSLVFKTLFGEFSFLGYFLPCNLCDFNLVFIFCASAAALLLGFELLLDVWVACGGYPWFLCSLLLLLGLGFVTLDYTPQSTGNFPFYSILRFDIDFL